MRVTQVLTKYCVQRTNIQNLKAIHNRRRSALWSHILCSKNEYTKSESNSQHSVRDLDKQVYCVQRTNIQNLKAIHNNISTFLNCASIVFKERIYKI